MSAWPELACDVQWQDDGLAIRRVCAEPRTLVASADRPLIIGVGEAHVAETASAAQLARVVAGLRPGGDPVAGGYAVAIVDAAARSVTLATDPFGVRPLYYWSDGDRVAFATRLSDLLRLGGIPAELDWTAVYNYLNFSYVPGPGTIFRDIYVLPPGAIARCARGKVEVSPYWDIAYPGDARGSEADLAARLREEIERAVRESRPSASAMGCFLSGGTDSGTITSILARETPALDAYSIGFSEDAYNELGYARLIAARHQLRHHVHVLTVEDFLASVPTLTTAFDQPFGNPSAIATWQCARLARETGVEVLVAGDGGDEIFGGNERYAKDRVYAMYHRLPSAVRRALLAVGRAVPGHGLLQNRARNFLERGNVPNPERLYSDDALASRYWDSLVAPELRARVTKDASLDVMSEHWHRIGPVHEIDRLMYVDLKTAIWGNDLVKVVSATRAAGVRVRFPFLDPRLASFTGRLEPRMKVRRLEKRYLFKRAVADILPADVISKPKHGFAVPVGVWVRTDRRVRDAVLDPILDSRSALRDCFTGAGLRQLVDDHLAGAWDHGVWLWALMMFARWDAVRRTDHV